MNVLNSIVALGLDPRMTRGGEIKQGTEREIDESQKPVDGF